MKILILLFLGTTWASSIDTSLKEFVSGSTLFSAVVFDRILSNNEGNVLVSPFSVESVLALTQSGAVGATGEEIRKSLYLPETQEETDALMQNVFPTIEDNEYTLHTANKIYVDDDFEIKTNFRRVATSVYQAQFQNIEFADSGAVDEINQWVEEETNDKIYDLLQPGDVDESTKAVLINALYFQGNWSTPFQKQNTKKLDFHASDNTVQTEFMYQVAQYKYYESPETNSKHLELPFRGKNASMTIILPNEKQGISLLEKQMKSVLVTPKYAQEYVEVYLPKFKIENKIDFASILSSMGMKAAFNPAEADFSGIAGSPGDIIINKITQKTYIDFSEGGVEAAAATSITIGTTSVVDTPTATKIFKADHPFLFYLKVNDIILFEGRFVKPEY